MVQKKGSGEGTRFLADMVKISTSYNSAPVEYQHLYKHNACAVPSTSVFKRHGSLHPEAVLRAGRTSCLHPQTNRLRSCNTFCSFFLNAGSAQVRYQQQPGRRDVPRAAHPPTQSRACRLCRFPSQRTSQRTSCSRTAAGRQWQVRFMGSAAGSYVGTAAGQVRFLNQ